MISVLNNFPLGLCSFTCVPTLCFLCSRVFKPPLLIFCYFQQSFQDIRRFHGPDFRPQVTRVDDDRHATLIFEERSAAHAHTHTHTPPSSISFSAVHSMNKKSTLFLSDTALKSPMLTVMWTDRCVCVRQQWCGTAGSWPTAAHSDNSLSDCITVTHTHTHAQTGDSP